MKDLTVKVCAEPEKYKIDSGEIKTSSQRARPILPNITEGDGIFLERPSLFYSAIKKIISIALNRLFTKKQGT